MTCPAGPGCPYCDADDSAELAEEEANQAAQDEARDRPCEPDDIRPDDDLAAFLSATEPSA